MGVRKQLMPLEDIQAALEAVEAVHNRLIITMSDLKEAKITSIEFDGIGNAARGVSAIGSYVGAIRGAMDDPNCKKVYATQPAKKVVK